LIFFNHFLIATCGTVARHGAIGANVNHYAGWSEAYPQSLENIEKMCARKPREQEILIAGMLSKSHLLDLLKNFVIYETVNNRKIKNVVHAEEYPRPDFNQMISTTVKLLDEYDIRFDKRYRIFVDGTNPSFIRSLKDRVDEDIAYEKQIDYYKKNYPSVYDLQFLQQNMFVIPVQFSKEHKHMLGHYKEMLEYQNGQVAIHPRFSKLITSLRTALEKGEVR
jgi:type I site-specific restriction-modification system R (restriction) subunit